MRRLKICFILLIACVLSAQAEDSIKVSAADLEALVRRVERLEQQTASPNKLGVDATTGATQVDARTEATPQDTARAQKKRIRKGRFTLGGYG